MSVSECALKVKCFKNIEECLQIIRAGGFRMNHTLVTNPEEVMIYGQHILNNNITVIRVGKKRYFLVKWLA
jgi:tyrosyl-tRNA synthetase